MTSDLVLAIRVLALRRRPTVRLVWLYLATTLPLAAPHTIKVRRTAHLLGLKPQRMRDALRDLVTHGYLECVIAPNGGAPGQYQFGPKGHRHRPSPARRGTSAAPVDAMEGVPPDALAA